MAADCIALSRMLRALADRTRLRILNLLREQEVCVCYFVEVLQTSQPKVSRHLAYLRGAGLVAARREGLWMHYRIAQPADGCTARVLEDVLACAANDSEMKTDRIRLQQACCAPQKFVALQGAPRPAEIHPAPKGKHD
jgi:ArsR family transcriptional regulator